MKYLLGGAFLGFLLGGVIGGAMFSWIGSAIGSIVGIPFGAIIMYSLYSPNAKDVDTTA